jgi:hypothetical protein
MARKRADDVRKTSIMEAEACHDPTSWLQQAIAAQITQGPNRKGCRE